MIISFARGEAEKKGKGYIAPFKAIEAMERGLSDDFEADLKIGVGFITPHPIAGFGGGGKIVIPGLGSMETIQSNHTPAHRGMIGGPGFFTRV
jgi:hypothetical protein